MTLPADVPGLEGLREVDAMPLTGSNVYGWLLDFIRLWDSPGEKSLALAGIDGLARLGYLLRAAPVARNFRKLRATGAAAATAADDYRGLTIWRGNGFEIADALRDASLESLGISDANFATVAPLLNAEFAGSLRSLDVSYNPLAADAYREFVAASPELKLKHLDVSRTVLCGPTLRNLLAARCCETLTELAVNDGSPERLDLGCLADSPFWSQAEQLSLSWSETVTAVTFGQLTRGAGPPALRSLDLGNNAFGSDDVRWLSETEWARPITWLNLAGNYLDSYAVRHLAQPGAFPNLRTLHLGHNNAVTAGVVGSEVNDDAIEALVNLPTLTRLRILTLTANPVTDAGVELLMTAPHFTLSGLGLGGTEVTAAGVRSLAKSPRLARLNWLDLSDNASLHSEALLPLAESPYLSPLCDLDISRTGASALVRDLLRQRLGRRLLD